MKTNKSLEQLLGKFMEPHQVKEAVDDIESGDRLFSDYPAPSVPEQTSRYVQWKVRNELRRHQTNTVLGWGTAAAAVAVILLAALYTVYDPQALPMSLPSDIAKSDNANVSIWAEHSDIRLTMIDTELTDIAESMDAIQYDTTGFAGFEAIDLLELEELELIASNTDFWKG